MQTGGGGFGIYNACSYRTDRTRSDSPCQDRNLIRLPGKPSGEGNLFPGVTSQWGRRCGGIQSMGECSSLPTGLPFGLPSLPVFQGVREPSLRELCTRSFFLNVRRTGARGNPIIQTKQQIVCPQELVDVTRLRLSREFNGGVRRLGGSTARLTSTMDCCAPSASFRSNVAGTARNPRVVPCRRDGYTRVE